MFVRYLPVILVLTALLLALAPLETAGRSASGPSASDAGRLQPEASRKADKTPLPSGSDARRVRPAEAFLPERIAPSDVQTPQAPSRDGVRTPDRATDSPAAKDDPRSVEEREDPGG